MSKPLKLFAPTIRWRDFKKIHSAGQDSGPTPVNFDRVLWELIKDLKVYCYLDPEKSDDEAFIIALELPKDREVEVVDSVRAK